MARRRTLTTDVIDSYADALFEVARRNMLDSGFVCEALMLLDAKARRTLITNLDGQPFGEQQDAVSDYIRSHQAKACVHVAQFKVSWLKEMAAANGYVERLPEHEPRKLVIASAYWPARSYSIVRMAEVIEQGGTRDLVGLDIPGTTLGSWLEDLLPRH